MNSFKLLSFIVLISLVFLANFNTINCQKDRSAQPAPRTGNAAANFQGNASLNVNMKTDSRSQSLFFQRQANNTQTVVLPSSKNNTTLDKSSARGRNSTLVAGKNETTAEITKSGNGTVSSAGSKNKTTTSSSPVSSSSKPLAISKLPSNSARGGPHKITKFAVILSALVYFF